MTIKPGGLPDSYEQLSVAFEKRVERTLQHYGIDYGGETYSAPGLAAIRRYQSKPKVNVAVDRDNMGSVVVICPFTGERIRAKCSSRFNLEGVSRYAWKKVGKYSKDRGISKARAMNELRELEKQAVKKGKVRKVRKPIFEKRQSLPSPFVAMSPEVTAHEQSPAVMRPEKKRTNVFDMMGNVGGNHV